MATVQDMIREEVWKKKLEKAGFRIQERIDAPAPILTHSPGSDANLMPTDRPPSGGT